MEKKPHSNFNLEFIFGKPLNVVDDIIAEKERHVRHFEIPKDDGSKRKLIAPDRDLKYIQKSICWRLLKRYKPSEAAHGFVAKRSIVTNAIFHVGARSVGKIDVKSFFDTINVDHLKNCLFGNKNVCRMCCYYESMLNGDCSPSLYANKRSKFKRRCEEIKAVYIPTYCQETGYQSLFTRVIELCTLKGRTVQGFPTSPYMANIVMRGFDKTMIQHCKQHDIAYSRYADDLAFSSKTLSKDELKGLIQKKVYSQLWAYNFKPNHKKTSWRSKGGRLRVCGIVVNVKTAIQRSILRLFRAKVHHATVKFADQTRRPQIRRLKGYASFIMSVNREQGEKYMKQLTDFEQARFPKAAKAD